MSSDAFRYRVTKVEGRDVVLEVRPTTAAGLCDLAWSRSFVLMLLREQGGPLTYEQTVSEAWLAEHLDEYIVRAVPEALTGLTYEPSLRRFGAQFCIPAEALQPRLTVRATLATEALAAHFSVGTTDGTTAYDVWLRDPKQVPLAGATTAPLTDYDPQPEFSRRIAAALCTRLKGWEQRAPEALHRAGPDATLRLELRDMGAGSLRSSVSVRLSLEVPAFELLPMAKKAAFGRCSLLTGTLAATADGEKSWFRRWAHEPERERLEYFADDAPLESFEAMVERMARALESVDLDALLARDGLRAMVEQGISQWPCKKGERAPTPVRSGAAMPAPAAWQWEWKHGHRWLPESIWARVALHAAFGSRDEARAALAQARALSKQPPALYKPLFASLDEG